MKIRPLYDRVVIRRKEEEETTAGGIVLPGTPLKKSPIRVKWLP
jgi:chaperonin GroES